MKEQDLRPRKLYSFKVTAGYAGCTLRTFLTKHCGLSRKRVREASLRGDILVDHQPQFLNQLVQAGQLIELYYQEHTTSAVEPQSIPLAIIYEDDDLLVVDKPAGLVVHPTRGYPAGTLANGIAHHWQQQRISEPVRIVTRLDRNTSGLVLVAKNELAHYLLVQDFNQGAGQKRYVALLEGNLAPSNGTISAPIDFCSDSIIKRCVSQTGKPAVTHYRTLRHLEDYTLVDIELETGRTHQIRVHFSYRGHPLVGDDLYGGKPLDPLRRQGLHAYSLAFTHPRDHEQLFFNSPLPQDIKDTLIHLTQENDSR